jgi:hypothetical protein
VAKHRSRGLARIDSRPSRRYQSKVRDRSHSISDWIETVVAKELENLDGLSREQLLDLRITALQKLEAAIAARLGIAFDPVIPAQAPVKSESQRQQIYAQSPLALAIPEYLTTCDSPQTCKQIAAAMLEGGRDFEAARPVHSVRSTLRKMVGTHPDIFHVAWSKWWLKSKCSKSQLDKYQAKNARFGTGGHSKKEHKKRTSEGIRERMSKGLRWGPLKATPELLEQAKEMLRNGVTLTEVCRTLDVATPTLYQYGIRQRALKKEGKLQKELALTETAPGVSGDELRARGVIPLHSRVVGEKE